MFNQHVIFISINFSTLSFQEMVQETPKNFGHDQESKELGTKKILEMQFLDKEEDEVRKGESMPLKNCDIFTGKWVFDNKMHPLYKEDESEFLSEWVTCTKN